MSKVQVPGKTVILATTLHLASTARLAMALTNRGCKVIVVCPPKHWVKEIDRVSRILRYNGLYPLASLESAITKANPDLIIPCDDRAVSHMQQLAVTTGSPLVRTVLEASLCSPDHYETTQSRYALLELATSLDIAVPETLAVYHRGQLQQMTEQLSGPWVIKADHSWAGMGVRIAQTLAEVEAAYDQMIQPMRLWTAVSEAIIDRNVFSIRPWMQQSVNGITIQTYVTGHPANCAVACWQGEVVGCITVEVITAESATGPATVVKVVNNAQMAEAARRIVKALKLTGMIGFDFMLDADGKAFLLEMNPRNVPICHMALSGERDLVERLVARLDGRVAEDRTPAVTADTITLFPNPIDSTTICGYYDVPWEEPRLLRRLLDNPQGPRERSWIVQAMRAARSVKAQMPGFRSGWLGRHSVSPSLSVFTAGWLRNAAKCIRRPLKAATE